MISELKLINQGDIIATYNCDGCQKELSFNDVKKYWEYASVEEVESIRLYNYNSCVAAIMLVAEGQGGVIVVWDAVEGKLVHVSEGSYVEAIAIHDSQIYSLSCISDFTTSAKFQMYKIELGIVDASVEGDCVECDIPEKVMELYDGNFENIELNVSAEGAEVVVSGECFKVLD